MRTRNVVTEVREYGGWAWEVEYRGPSAGLNLRYYSRRTHHDPLAVYAEVQRELDQLEKEQTNGTRT